MKKLFSAVLAGALLLSCLLCAMPVMADNSDFPEPNWNYMQDIMPYVNGVQNPNDIEHYYDQSSGTHTYTYIGDGTVTGWGFPWSVEGTDYSIVSESGNSVTLRFLNDVNGIPYINALVDSGAGSTSSAQPDETESQTGSQTQPAGSSETSITSAPSETAPETTAAASSQTGAPSHIVPAVVIGVVCVAVVAVIVVLVVAARKKKH